MSLVLSAPRRRPALPSFLAPGEPRRFLLRVALMLLAVAAVWAPHLAHFHIDRGAADPARVEVLRRQPRAQVLQELGSMVLLSPGAGASARETVARAERALGGWIEWPGLTAAPLPLRGHPHDHLQGPPTFRLMVAGLGVEALLLDAHRISGDPRFLEAALHRTLGFAEHERAQRTGAGFLFNDHAIAARVGVLVRLWQLLREGADLSPAQAQALVSLALRSGRWLAAPGHFTVRTNHGVMQNLALLQLAAAFPALDEADRWRELAVERLRTQLGFYVSPEGFVLEHSALYHRMGVELLSMAVRLAVLNGLEPPEELGDAVQRSRAVLRSLIRPDGSLPLLGNTARRGGADVPTVPGDGRGPLGSLPAEEVSGRGPQGLFPVSGYALWWTPEEGGTPAQTLLAWAKHDGHGHKHADEGSLLFWSGGVEWLTATGYWPYGADLAEEAYGWRGSNAPHLAEEPADSARSTRLRASAVSGPGPERFVDLERSARGAVLRRQLLQIDARTLLVLDFSQGADGGTEVLWTVDPRLRLQREGETAFSSSPAPDGRRLLVAHASQPAARLGLQRGETGPFAGWTVADRQPTPADALQVHSPHPRAVQAALFRIEPGAPAAAVRVDLAAGAAPEAWSAVLTLAPQQRLAVRREGGTLSLRGEAPHAAHRTLELDAPPQAGAQQEALRLGFARAVAQYPPWRDLGFYRERVAWAFLAVFALSELLRAAWLHARRAEAGGAGRRISHGLLCVLWLGLPVLALAVYLRV